jgi:hypothetical protein
MYIRPAMVKQERRNNKTTLLTQFIYVMKLLSFTLRENNLFQITVGPKLNIRHISTCYLDHMLFNIFRE